MLYVYGAVPAGQTAPAVVGLDGRPVSVLPAGEVAVAVSSVAARPEPTPERLAQHHRVAMALLQGGGIVPFRFGNVFRDEEELARKLAPRSSELVSKLEQVAGCVEVGVQLPMGSQPDSFCHRAEKASGKGTAYLLRKKRAFAAEEATAARVEALGERLAGLIKGARYKGAKAAFLVERSGVAELKARLAQLEPEAQVSGPWAPSSFV